MVTKADVIRRAFRFIGVAADDEALTADQIAAGEELLDGIYAELEMEAPPSFTTADVDPASATPLAMVLAAELGAQYAAPAPFSRSAAMLRLMGTIRPDDRPEITDSVDY